MSQAPFKLRIAPFLLLLIGILIALNVVFAETSRVKWSQEEVETLTSLSLQSLPPLPDDPSNDYDTDPQAARLGEIVFDDERFSANGEVSCASCHLENKVFQDGLPRAEGLEVGPRRTMPLIGVAYNDWFFWDGRKDSLWSQALGPIENPLEHGISRTKTVYLIDEHYKRAYETVFGELPEFPGGYPEIARPTEENATAARAWQSIDKHHRDLINVIYANIGKAVAAYVRTILPDPAPFDRFVRALSQGDREKADSILSRKQQRGLKIFIGRGGCTSCHTGPLLTNNQFHDTGVNDMQESEYDAGRAKGIPKVQHDRFNCLGAYSDAEEGECMALRYMDTSTEKYRQAFKTPTLRNVTERPPYFHAGQTKTVREVITFYIEESEENPELEHLDLTQEDVDELVAFLRSLNGPVHVHRDLIGRLPRDMQ